MRKLISGNFKDKLFAVAALLFIGVAFYQLVAIGESYGKSESTYKQIKQTAVKGQALKKGEKEKIEGTEVETEEKAFDYRKVRIDFDSLLELNEDVVGWILFDKNGISYPILQGEDNEEYLYKMADQTRNKAGSIFVDALCSPDFMDAHTIIYGHNMKDLSMFGKLKNYRLNKNYYKKNRYFTIYTPEYIYRYEIFAWYEVEKEDGVYQVGYENGDDFARFVEQMQKRAYQDTEAKADGDDKVVTLSTCSADGKRFVVHGKRVRALVNQ